MRVKTIDGWTDVRVGQRLHGLRFIEVSFTSEDFAVIGFDEWLHEAVIPHMYPASLEREI